MKTPGMFITLEGSEGAGKSTNLQAMCELLTDRGVDFYQTREPGGTPMAEALRTSLLATWDEQVNGLTELLVVFAARNQHVENEIKPRLARGQWVVCDRFTDASYAYQGMARGVPLAYVEALEQWVQGDLRPNLTLYLDLDPQLGQARIASRERDRMEQEQADFFAAVRKGYLARAASQPNIRTIDASVSLPEVQHSIAEILTGFVNEIQNSASQ
jgi:dTMP kinase